jgi:hypothetical protein
VKKPWLCVENDGYPPAEPIVFNLADSQMTGVPFEEYPLTGLDRPLELMFSPGLDQPPPGTGDGLRDRDIGVLGVPAPEGSNFLSATERHVIPTGQVGSRHNVSVWPAHQQKLGSKTNHQTRRREDTYQGWGTVEADGAEAPDDEVTPLERPIASLAHRLLTTAGDDETR